MVLFPNAALMFGSFQSITTSVTAKRVKKPLSKAAGFVIVKFAAFGKNVTGL
jgi:hypothetical protein